MAKRSEKTSFSLTCSLLSQYIRENGSIADLGIAAPASRTTMSLLSGIDASGDGAKEGFSSHNAARSMDLFPQHKSPEDSQLTIFYGGKVLVFDNFPAERANDLMQIASKGQSFPARPRPSFSDLPIARSASLHRFLQKRRARISALSPYQLSSSNGPKEEISQLCLGLRTHVLNPDLNSNCLS